MNYQIIKNTGELINFIEWLPDLSESERFYVALFARKKYAPDSGLKNDKCQLKRFLATKENLILKLQQLELSLGYYSYDGLEIPQESLAVYITPNPRCLQKAVRKLGKTCWNIVDLPKVNPVAEAMTCVHQSKSRTIIMDFDVDNKENLTEDIGKLNEIIGSDSFTILETRGGYHIMVNPKMASAFREHHNFNKNWYGVIMEEFKPDVTGDNLIPIPGCTQGNYIPILI
mgnify:CR=1 FL=1